MRIRNEQQRDYAHVYKVNVSAFKTSAESDLVDVLRKEDHSIISLVAEEDGDIEGHIMFSSVSLSGRADLKIMGLGPVAVEPKQQRKGVGSALVTAGLEGCKELGFGAVVVLGHKDYYPRFGFTPCVQYGIECEYDVPPDAFMVLELQAGYLQGVHGVIKYHPAFNGV